MILPSKHLSISESLFGLGGCLLAILKKPMTVDELWWDFLRNKEFSAHHAFDDVVMALNYLYSIGAVDVNKEGLIYNAVA